MNFKFNIDQESDIRLLRLSQILELVPMARSTFWEKVKARIIPPPIHPFGPGLAYWRYRDIKNLIK